MNRFAIITRNDEVSQGIEKRLRNDLTAAGYIEVPESPDTVFVIGGDGTFIYAVHHYMYQLKDICFYGIHTGTLGFYTDYRDTDYDEFLDVFLNHRAKEVIYPVLRAKTEKTVYYAINEIRIENTARTQVIDVYVDGNHFEKIRGTGICICTQLGSTAYNRSLGGAVIQEGIDLMEMCEIAGIHHSKYRSLGSPILMKNSAVVDFCSENFKGAVLGADADVFPLEDETKISVSVCTIKKVRMLRGRDVSYFSRLKSLF